MFHVEQNNVIIKEVFDGEKYHWYLFYGDSFQELSNYLDFDINVGDVFNFDNSLYSIVSGSEEPATIPQGAEIHEMNHDVKEQFWYFLSKIEPIYLILK